MINDKNTIAIQNIIISTSPTPKQIEDEKERIKGYTNKGLKPIKINSEAVPFVNRFIKIGLSKEDFKIVLESFRRGSIANIEYDPKDNNKYKTDLEEVITEIEETSQEFSDKTLIPLFLESIFEYVQENWTNKRKYRKALPRFNVLFGERFNVGEHGDSKLGLNTYDTWLKGTYKAESIKGFIIDEVPPPDRLKIMEESKKILFKLGTELFEEYKRELGNYLEKHKRLPPVELINNQLQLIDNIAAKNLKGVDETRYLKIFITGGEWTVRTIVSVQKWMKHFEEQNYASFIAGSPSVSLDWQKYDTTPFYAFALLKLHTYLMSLKNGNILDDEVPSIPNHADNLFLIELHFAKEAKRIYSCLSPEILVDDFITFIEQDKFEVVGKDGFTIKSKISEGEKIDSCTNYLKHLKIAKTKILKGFEQNRIKPDNELVKRINNNYDAITIAVQRRKSMLISRGAKRVIDNDPRTWYELFISKGGIAGMDINGKLRDLDKSLNIDISDVGNLPLDVSKRAWEVYCEIIDKIEDLILNTDRGTDKKQRILEEIRKRKSLMEERFSKNLQKITDNVSSKSKGTLKPKKAIPIEIVARKLAKHQSDFPNEWRESLTQKIALTKNKIEQATNEERARLNCVESLEKRFKFNDRDGEEILYDHVVHYEASNLPHSPTAMVFSTSPFLSSNLFFNKNIRKITLGKAVPEPILITPKEVRIDFISNVFLWQFLTGQRTISTTEVKGELKLKKAKAKEITFPALFRKRPGKANDWYKTFLSFLMKGEHIALVDGKVKWIDDDEDSFIGLFAVLFSIEFKEKPFLRNKPGTKPFAELVFTHFNIKQKGWGLEKFRRIDRYSERVKEEIKQWEKKLNNDFFV